MRTNLPVTQQQKPVTPDQRLITTTNLKGVITYANDDFVDVSGFSRDELIGQAHNIIRHPDVPSAVFAHMWRYLKAGRSWMGIVKNRCKDGGYYWVDAFVTPVLDDGKLVGYESVRVKARPADIARATALYARINADRRAIRFDGTATLRSLLPGMLCGLIASAPVLLWGLPGLIPGLLLAAPVGWYLQRQRERKLSSHFADGDDSITDPLLAQMYTSETGASGLLQTALYSQQARIRTFLSRVGDYTRRLEVQANHGATLAAESLEKLERQRAETDQVAAAVSQMSATSHEVSSNVTLTAAHLEKPPGRQRKARELPHMPGTPSKP